jgi:sugar/nucleoside kinase (ribokinase family)
MALLEEGLLDLVFANEEEAVALWQQLDSSSSSSSSSSTGGAAGAAEAARSTDQGPAEAEAEAEAEADSAAKAEAEAADEGRAASTAQQQEDAALREVHAAQDFLLKYCKVSVVSLGARGCVAKSRQGAYGMAPACLVDVKDTIGAGDYFTSGFLYGYLQGASLQQCAVCGCAAGAEAVQAVGAELSEGAYERLRQQVQRTVGVDAN